MCGITAYRGKKQAAPILLEALRKLEYRGYDSAGIATSDGKIHLKKGVGKVDVVDKEVNFSELPGTVGIAHSRWATTGSVTKENAHPHISEELAIVHNGIVENYQELKKNIKRKLQSETDTEVILGMLEESKGELLQRVHDVFAKLHGRNAFVVMQGNTLIAVRKGSPLVLGISPDGVFLASDVSPLLEHTRDMIFLDDNEIVVVNDTYKVYDATTLEEKKKEVTTVDWTMEQAQKGKYEHFMLKEIMEQQTSIHDAISQDRGKIESVAKMINDAFGTYIVGCGSAAKVGLAATYIFSSIAKHHLNFTIGSEFPNYHDFLTDKSLLIAISQSGETADTMEAIETAKDKGGKIVSVVNVLGSTMDRISDESIPVCAGPEISVCSTKAITNQLAIMYLLAYTMKGKYDEGLIVLKKTADSVKELLDDHSTVKQLAKKLKDYESMYIIGRGQNYPVALESAIKIQEVSYIHAEAFAAGELKHGPIALIDKGTPLIVFAPNDSTKKDVITNALEVKARGGFIIGIAPENNEAFDVWLKVPDFPETSPIVNLIPVQLLAYYLAVEKGTDVDQPKNLAKAVSVK